MCDIQMADYLLDTNAYFALLKYISLNENNEEYEKVINGNCYISKLTQIEIISVIGQYARGNSGSIQICERIYEDETTPCGKKFITAKRKKWSQQKTKDWLKLEKDISNGRNSKFNVKVLDIDQKVISEAQHFIQKALIHNFKSMDAMILGTAKANSNEEKKMIVVTADKGLKAGMDKIEYPYITFN